MTDLPWGNNQNLTDEEILKIESLVNEAINKGYVVNTILTSIEEEVKKAKDKNSNEEE